MKITQQHEERCPLWCRFFVCHATNFAPCAARDGPQTVHNAQHASFVVHFSMPAALKPVVEVRRSTYNAHWAMKCEVLFIFQCSMLEVQCTGLSGRRSRGNVFTKREQCFTFTLYYTSHFFDFLLFFFYYNYYIEKKRDNNKRRRKINK